MGQLTRSSIVKRGLLLAGNDSLTDEANIWLNAGLRALYKSWPWPSIHDRKSGLSLAKGTTSFLFGNGSNGVTPEVQRIFDPIWVYDGTFTTKGLNRIRVLTGGPLQSDETINDPATTTGQPTTMKVRADTTLWGRWKCIPMPVPDRDYLLALDYLFQPADIATSSTGDNVVPIYPSDRTLIHLVLVEALRYMQDYERLQFEGPLLEDYKVSDRVMYGEVPGTNDQLGLDTSVFR